MQFNTKPIKFVSIIVLIALFLVWFYGSRKQVADQGLVAPSHTTVQRQIMVKDPFKEFQDKQQQDAINPHSQAQPSQQIQIVNGNSTTTVPVGTDPFKAFLEAQAKAKPEEATISPFSGRK